MNRMVHDGTPCSYDDAFSVCVRGECEHVGCDGLIASDQQEDRCGVCGGDNSSCKIIKGNFTRSTKKQGYLKILEVPKGARHLLIQEFRGTPHILAVKNLETGNLFLNDQHELPESRVVIEKGVAWEYRNSEELESLQTAGPLKYAVLLMVRSHGDSKVTVSYKYIIQDRLRSSLESNLVQEDAVFYEWALKKWSHCSKPCGGGKQYTRFGCRRKADGKMVQRTFCSNINKPRAISRNCNTEACRSPRWLTGDWQPCSASCGQTGWQRRWVSCQQASSGGQQRSINSNLCGDDRPDAKQPCNRFPCPAAWRVGPWTPCSASCGNGTQERQIACSGPQGSATNCSEPPPMTARSCQAPPCTGDQKNAIIQWLSRSNPDFPSAKISSRQRCRGDRSVFCRMEVLSRYCSIAGYQQMCCKSCSESSSSNSSNSSNSSSSTTLPTDSISSWTLTTRMMTSASTWSDSSYIISDIISTLPPSFTVTPPPISRTSTDFIYMDYDDYEEYLSYEDPSLLSKSPHVSPSTTTTTTTTSTTNSAITSSTASTTATTTTSSMTTTRRPRKTVPPHFFWRKTTTVSPAMVPMVTVDVGNQTAVPDDIIPSTSSGGWSLHSNITSIDADSTSFFPLLKKDNNSVDEVPYRIVGLDGDANRGQQNYFVPRMPPLRERTQNKRIQQLLNERRRQELLRKPSRTSTSRTVGKH